jgi:hypothetical protein
VPCPGDRGSPLDVRHFTAVVVVKRHSGWRPFLTNHLCSSSAGPIVDIGHHSGILRYSDVTGIKAVFFRATWSKLQPCLFSLTLKLPTQSARPRHRLNGPPKYLVQSRVR